MIGILATSGGFISIVPAGSCIASFSQTSLLLSEHSPSLQSKSISPNTYSVLLPSGQVHIKGLLHSHFWCTKILEAETSQAT